jgi:hypothetical protein
MSPSPGLRLGHYEVYRVKDTRLPRDPAVKISAENFTKRSVAKLASLPGSITPTSARSKTSASITW